MKLQLFSGVTKTDLLSISPWENSSDSFCSRVIQGQAYSVDSYQLLLYWL